MSEKTENNCVNRPVPFEDNWIISHINVNRQIEILLSDNMYSDLLSAILENEINNNVIINNTSDTCMVYLNHNSKYVYMSNEKMFNATMEKLYNILTHMNNMNKNNLKTYIFRHYMNCLEENNLKMERQRKYEKFEKPENVI